MRRDFQIGKLRQELIGRGHKLDSNHLPLSRRATGTKVNTWVCWRWDGVKYTWWKEGWKNHRCAGTDGKILSRGPELTYVEWEFTDLNGDGYPDFVFNSSPTGFQLRPPDMALGVLVPVVDGAFDVPFEPEEANAVRAVFNRSGLLFGTNDYPFTKSVSLAAQTPELGVGYWASREILSGHHDGQWYDRPTAEQTMLAGFADVNGDGLADRVVNKDAYLGTYAGAYRSQDITPSFSRIHLKLPGPLATQHSGQKAQCKRSSDKFTTRQHQGLRDLTGDGIPDYYDKGKVWIGGGGGFPRSVGVNHLNGFAFTFSHQTETCDGRKSYTDGGLYDIDGDGKPEVVGLVGKTFIVSQLVGGSAWGVPEAGRLTQVDNGYGAVTRISYLSAKDKAPLGHQVPFPEIVVGAVETVGVHNLGGGLAGARYAYDNAELIYDQVLDRFVFPGYQRFVELSLFGLAATKPLGAATVIDAWPLTPFQPGLAKKDRWLRARRVGRLRNVFTLRGSERIDPWAFLAVDANDALVVGATHYEWDAKLYETSDPDTVSIDCLDMIYPLDFQKSLVNSTGGVNPCRSHGFVFGRARESWYGARPPPSDNNLQTRSRALEVDDYGRVTFA